MSVITISRQQCSFGNEIAASLAQKLGFSLITHETLLSEFFGDASAHERHMLTESAKFYLTEKNTGITYLSLLINRLREYTQKNDCVMVGFGSQSIFAGDKDALHVRVFAPDNLRLERLRRQYRVSEQQALKILEKTDRKQKRFVSALFGISIADVSHYHIMLNTCMLTVDECVAAVMAMHSQRAVIERIENETQKGA
ncbi:MAG: cytidylate kinase-like family protein, partial [Christensenellales bacterium]